MKLRPIIYLYDYTELVGLTKTAQGIPDSWVNAALASMNSKSFTILNMLHRDCFPGVDY